MMDNVPNQSAVLLKCDFDKAPKLTGMQLLPLLRFQFIERVEAYLKMLADPSTVEFTSYAGELDLSMQRFVRDAERRAVGHAKAETIRCDGGELHVKRDGARLRQAANGRDVVAELPISVVDAGHRAGAHHPFLARFEDRRNGQASARHGAT